ncbi:hypothetical protein D3C85_844390 [compost metagenome]
MLSGLTVGDVSIDRQNGLRLAIIVSHQGSMTFERDGAAIPASKCNFVRPVTRFYQAVSGRIESGATLVDQLLCRFAECLFL